MEKCRFFLVMLLGFLVLSGCRTLNKEETKADLEYEIVEEDEIPEEMKSIIEQEKEKGFQITYEENGELYIGQGYGEKEQEGYEIEVDLCQSSPDFVYFHTILKGPAEEAKEKNKSWPDIVVRVRQSGKHVIFLND